MGTRSRIYTDQTIKLIRKMRRDGASCNEIAMAIGTTAARLRSRLSRLGISRKRGKVNSAPVRIPGAVLETFATLAATRKTTSHRLVRQVLTHIARDDLFSAILDDGK